MTIKTNKHGLIVLKALSAEEKPIFAKFLMLERERHQEDIDNIDETLARLRLAKTKKCGKQ